MKLQLTAAEEAFRREARAFLQTHWGERARGVTGVRLRAVQRGYFQALAARGWLVGQWPEELGGSGWSDSERLLWEQEAALAWAPPISVHGADLLGMLLREFGNAEQKAAHLPAIASGKVIWCQAFIEDSGPLASERIECRATSSGSSGEWLLEGTKPWVLDVPQADEGVSAWFYVLAATPTAESPESLSVFLVERSAPDVSVHARPMIGESIGQNVVSEVIFNRVALSAEALLGARGSGADYAQQIESKRLSLPGAVARSRVLFDQLRSYVDADQQVSSKADNELEREKIPPADQGLRSDPDFQARLSSAEIELAGLQALEWRAFSSEEYEESGESGEASGSELREARQALRLALAARAEPLNQQLGDLLVEALGYFAAPFLDSYALDNEVPIGPEFAQRALLGMLSDHARAAVGAPDERLKNMIAKSVLALPETN